MLTFAPPRATLIKKMLCHDLHLGVPEVGMKRFDEGTGTRIVNLMASDEDSTSSSSDEGSRSAASDGDANSPSSSDEDNGLAPGATNGG